jgi:hypothetical protein
MSKPILVVRMPALSTTEMVVKTSETLSIQLDDYHPIVFIDNNVNTLKFEIYSEKQDIDIEKLIKKIKL